MHDEIVDNMRDDIATLERLAPSRTETGS